MKQVGAFAAAMLLVCVASLAQEPPKLPLEKDKPYVHQPTGFILPASLGDFQRVSGYRLNAAGSHIAVGYNSPRVAATLYIKPKSGQTLQQQIDDSKKSIKIVHPKAKLLSETPTEIKQDKQTYSFARAVYELQMSDDDPQMVRSEFYLLEFSEHFLKYRISCSVSAAEQADKEISRLLSGLLIPLHRDP